MNIQNIHGPLLGDVPPCSCRPVRPDAEWMAKVLSKLSPLEYEQRRIAEAQRIGIRASVLDAAVERHRGTDGGEAQGQSPVEHLEPWHDRVDGAALAAEIRDRLRAHVIFERNCDADALAVWVIGAYALDVWGIFPKVLVTAPERACGKSTLANVLSALSPRALPASNASAAAIFRAIELWAPTLVLDEIDTWLPEKPELRGVINSGHERDMAYILRCVGDDHEPRQFSTWCPMILSGIGRPADTVVSRSVVVSLRRRLPSEPVTRRPVGLKGKVTRVRRQCLRWVEDNKIRLAASEIEPPECGDDRRRDNFLSLYRVAEALGGDWPARIEAAYLAGAESDDVEESAGVMLLRDVMELFEAEGSDRITTKNILGALNSDDEKPWSEWRRGKPANDRTLAKLLKAYGVAPRTIRLPNGSTPKGYHRPDIASAYSRYCGAATTPPRWNQRDNSDSNSQHQDPRGGLKTGKTQQNQERVVVADKNTPDPEAYDPEAWK